jgi:hypothetical protein
MEAANQPDLLRLGGVGAALDTHADRLIVFFYKAEDQPGETWSLNLRTRTWENLNPKNQPASRRFTSLVYDPQADKTFLFGGVLGDDETRPNNELWAFDYASNAWSKIQAQDAPPATYFQHMAYDGDHQAVLMWGGKSPAQDAAFWAFDSASSRWEKIPYQGGPKLDYDGSMAYAQGTGRVYLYIGLQFWVYDFQAKTWEQLPTPENLGKIYATSLLYDPSSQKVVLFGGTGDNDTTWVFSPDTQKWTGYAPVTEYQ